MRNRHLCSIALAVLSSLLGSCGSSGSGRRAVVTQLYPTPPSFSRSWRAVTELIRDQRVSKAEELARKLVATARGRGSAEEWAHGLIEVARLRMSLHGYEKAVRFLKDQPWPKSIEARAVVELYYAHALAHYARVYAWEIRKRERIVSLKKVDLKAWTAEQIYTAAFRAFADLWKRRQALGTKRVVRVRRYLSYSAYPEGIRDTLRDLVGHLFVRLLTNTQSWSPRHTNELFQLDLGSLLEPQKGTLDLADADVHPLKRAVAILDDLERWNRSRGQLEAALDARIERASRLLAAFKKEADRERIRADLIARMNRGDALKWAAVGYAAVANSLRVAGHLVRARAVAARCAARYADTIGGRQCKTLVGQIEHWGFKLASTRSDAPGKRSIEVSHRNLRKVYFRAYRFNLIDRIESANDYNLLPSHRRIKKLIESEQPDVRWTSELPATPDFKFHRTFVTPPLTRPGAYVVVASKRPDFKIGSGSKNQAQALNFVITDLVMLARSRVRGEQTVEATVVEGASGAPVKGAEVRLYAYDWKDGHSVVQKKRTDSDGYVEFRGVSNKRAVFLVASHRGQHVLDPTYRRLYPYYRRPPRTAELIYTDRTVYRPLQRVQWKVIAFRADHERGSFHTRPNGQLVVDLRDANGRTVERKIVTTNDHGTASGSFRIPKGRLLGRWRVATTYRSYAAIRVEEYKRPTFEAKLLAPEAALRLNRRAELTGGARYYFGLPVASGQVRWRVTRLPMVPRWYGWRWWAPRPQPQTQTVAAGSSTLDSDGKFRIAFTPKADERDALSGVSYRYVVHADITDEGGETRPASRTFRLGFVAVHATIDLGRGFLLSGAPSEVTVRRTDLSATPRAGSGQWRLVALRQPVKTLPPAEQPVGEAPPSARKRFTTPGDKLRSRANPRYSARAVLRGWEDGPTLARGEVRHGINGLASIALRGLRAGAYRMRYETRDEYGAIFKTQAEFVVAATGAATDVRLPLLLRAEQTRVAAGGVVRLLALSGIRGQRLVFERFREGKRILRRVLSADGPAVVELPVGMNDRGGFTVSLTAVNDHQLLSASQRIFVPWEDRQLKISFSTFRDKIRPGTRETWRVQVRGHKGALVRSAELLAYMYDRSLDLFAPHRPPNPLSFFPRRDQWVRFQSTVGPAGLMYQVNRAWVASYSPLRGHSLNFYASYGIGGFGRRHYYRRGPMDLQSVVATGGMRLSAGAMLRRAPGVAAPAPPPAPRQDSSDERKMGNVRGRFVNQASSPPALRTEFAETAVWTPHLLVDAQGTASIELRVPDSVTEWNVWVHAITRDFRSGSVTKRTKSIKDLMVRPYLPRFLREGDRAAIKVVINNAGGQPLSGHLSFDVIDPDTKKSVVGLFSLQGPPRRPFRVKAGGSTNLTFQVRVPSKVGSYAFQATAEAGDLRDGERRALPVLPSRVHLIQSRFTSLSGPGRKVLTFEDMAKGGDPTRNHEQLVVTLDAQLFYQALAALPYLRRYPYECSEQTLNRFVSSGIVSALYDKYPAVRRMARKLSMRETPLEQWDQADPNRKMALEETPWVTLAAGGRASRSDINVLDPRVAKAERIAALARLKKLQTSSGGFPWFPGGPPSPYLTLYLLHGFAKAVEFGVQVPMSMVRSAWAYAGAHYRDKVRDLMRKKDCCWSFLTFLNYVASAFPKASWRGGALSDSEREEILDYSFKHWRRHSPYLKGYLALTLNRAGRKKDAWKVFASVMDSAKTSPLLGTYWAPESRSWLWYNDTVETHAFALRALMELRPKDSRRAGLVHWLLLNKKLNHWKSTRATAEAIYALIHYLKAEGQLGIREDAKVKIGPKTAHFLFEPDEYTGKKNQVVIPGAELDPKTQSKVVVEKTTKGTLFASATWHFSTEKLPTEERGDFFHVARRFFKREQGPTGPTLTPLGDGAIVRVGDQIEVQLSLRTKHTAEYVHLRVPRAAGLEPERAVSRYRSALGIGWYEETRDSGNNFFFERLPVGEFPFKYRLRAAMEGVFRIGPAVVQSMYAPEFAAYSTGKLLKIAPAK